PNDAPTPRGGSDRHCQSAKADDPFRQNENRRLEKTQPGWQMIEASGVRAGKQCERNDAHCFLRVICAMTVRHPGRAEDLQLPEQRMNKSGGESVQCDEK